MLNRHRRALTIIAILTTGLLIPLFLSFVADAQGPDEFETYQSSDGLFTFQYPEDWFVSQEQGIIFVGNSEESFLLFDELEDGDVVLLIIPPDEVASVMGVDAVGSPTQVMDRYLESTDSGNVVSYGQAEGIIIGETVGVRVEVSDFEVEGWVYMIDAGDDTVLMVLAAAPLQHFQEHAPAVEAILNSLQFDTISVESTLEIPPTPLVFVVTTTPVIQATPLRFVTPTPIPSIAIQTSPLPTIELDAISMTATALFESFMPTPTPTERAITVTTGDTPTLFRPTLPPTWTPFPTIISSESNNIDYEGTITALESTIAAWQATATALSGDNTQSDAPECEVYVVQTGDTLFSIAVGLGVNADDLTDLNELGENPILFVGQELFIPSETCQPPIQLSGPIIIPTMTQTPIPTALSDLDLEIVSVDGAGDITIEVVEIQNHGGVTDLTGWTLEDEDGNVFEFPEMRIFTNSRIRIFSRDGQNTPIALFWNANEAIWQTSETATLLNADGDVVTTFLVDEE